MAGPITFFLFSAPLQAIVAAHGLQCIVYAEDIQLFITFPPEDRARELALRKMEACIADIRSWCKQNMLILNDSKTELIHFSSKYCKSTWSPELKTRRLNYSTIDKSSKPRCSYGSALGNVATCKRCV